MRCFPETRQLGCGEVKGEMTASWSLFTSFSQPLLIWGGEVSLWGVHTENWEPAPSLSWSILPGFSPANRLQTTKPLMVETLLRTSSVQMRERYLLSWSCHSRLSHTVLAAERQASLQASQPALHL